MTDLRISRVEDHLGQLTNIIGHMGKTAVTESAQRRMVGYLGSIDEMRGNIVVMVQRYEEDDTVLPRLLDLVDRIDDVKQLAATAQKAAVADQPLSPGGLSSPSFTNPNDDEDIARQYDNAFNPLMVSNKDFLGVSGLADLYGNKDLVEGGHADDEDEDEDEETARAIAELEEQERREEEELRRQQEEEDFRLAQQLANEEDGFAGSSTTTTNNVSLRESQLNLPHVPPTRSYLDTSLSSSSSSSSSGGDDDVRPPPYVQPAAAGAHRFVPGRIRANTTVISRYPASSSSSSSSSTTTTTTSSSSAVSKQKIIPPVECKICYEEYEQWSEVHKLSGCGHIYCKDCLNDYLQLNIKEGAVLDLLCPNPECDVEVSPTDIKKVCTPDVFARYEKFTVIAALRADPNARWCPNPECNMGTRADPNKTWVECTGCKFMYCTKCLGQRHDGANCGKEALALLEARREADEQAQKKFDDWTTEQNRRVKPCPNCKTFIEKNEGCNHMTCANVSCRTQFCWLCMKVYSATHYFDLAENPDCYDKQFWSGDIDNPYQYNYAPPYVPGRAVRARKVAKKVGIYVGLGVAVVTLGVPAAVIGGPVYGCFQLHKRLKARRARQARQDRLINGGYNYNPNFVPPTNERIREAQEEVARLRALGL